MNSMVIFHRFLQRLPGRVTGESKLMELVDETAVWVSGFKAWFHRKSMSRQKQRLRFRWWFLVIIIHDEWWLMMDPLWIIAETDRKMPFLFLFGPAGGGACKMIYDLGNLGTTQKVIVCFVDTWAYLLPCQEWWNLMVIWSDLFELLMIVVHILISTEIEDVSTQSLFQLLCSSYQSCNWNIMFIAAKFNVCNMIDCWYTLW